MLNRKIAPLAGWLCGLLVFVNALQIFGKNIYPLLADSRTLSVNLPHLGFDFNVIGQEIGAYFLVVVSVALPGRSRSSWWLSILLLIAMLAGSLLGLPEHTATSLQLAVTLVVLLVCYRFFDRQLYLSYSFVFISAFVIFALCFGTFGSYILRSQFHNLSSLGDAFYFTLETYSTVGYGDIVPLTSTARYFVVALICIGLIMFTSGITLIAYLLNAKIKTLLFHFNKGKIAMTNHIIFMGYSVFTKILLKRYHKQGEQCLVIDQEPMSDLDGQDLQEAGNFLLTAYPGCSDVLLRGRVSEAKLIVVSFERDADTIFALMNLTEHLVDASPRPLIIARVFYEDNIEKAKRAGADRVVAPHLLVADAIMNLGT